MRAALTAFISDCGCFQASAKFETCLAEIYETEEEELLTANTMIYDMMWTCGLIDTCSFLWGDEARAKRSLDELIGGFLIF